VSEHRWLLIETSGREGLIGLSVGATVIAEKRLDGSRRHVQDLAPAMSDLLIGADWDPSHVYGVAVSLGPGSYTGLRVGVMSAKAFAFATGCRLVGIPTFHILARQSDLPALRLEVIADALKDKLYVQSFARRCAADEWATVRELAILPKQAWLSGITSDLAVSGPGVPLVEKSLSTAIRVADPAQRKPALQALLDLAGISDQDADRPVSLTMEPIYLRPSSAEEQWAERP
jgi:tRNA threonylcarbamoyladenosine biosynthesis protein TsaB